MLDKILDAAQQDLVARTRSTLLSTAEILATNDTPEESRKQVSASIHQIDALFLLVGVREELATRRREIHEF